MTRWRVSVAHSVRPRLQLLFRAATSTYRPVLLPLQRCLWSLPWHPGAPPANRSRDAAFPPASAGQQFLQCTLSPSPLALRFAAALCPPDGTGIRSQRSLTPLLLRSRRQRLPRAAPPDATPRAFPSPPPKPTSDLASPAINENRLGPAHCQHSSHPRS